MKNTFWKYLAIFLLTISILYSCKSDNNNTSGEEITSEETTFSDADFSGAFVGSFDMLMEMHRNGEKMGPDVPPTTYYSDGKLIAVDITTPGGNGKMRSIFNSTDNTVIALMNEGGKKVAMKMGIPQLEDLDAKSAESSYSVEETNEKRDIDGYPCRKYIITTEQGTSEVWVTNKIKGNLYDVIASGVRGRKGKWYNNARDVKGFPLEIRTVSDEEETVVKFRNIKPGKVDPSVFSTEGYEVQDMSSLNKLIEKAARKQMQ